MEGNRLTCQSDSEFCILWDLPMAKTPGAAESELLDSSLERHEELHRSLQETLTQFWVVLSDVGDVDHESSLSALQHVLQLSNPRENEKRKGKKH